VPEALLPGFPLGLEASPIWRQPTVSDQPPSDRPDMLTQHGEDLLLGTFDLATHSTDGKDIAVYRS
jgi:hypothetical protein